MSNKPYSYRHRSWAIAALAGASCFAFATPALAQSAQASATAGPEEQGSLQDIVVTARKRAENLRDVPVAITAIGGEMLQQKNITQVIDLPQITPNFSFSYGAVQPFTFIRGFGSGANASFEQSVGKFIDNVSFGRDQDGRIPIFDVERLEVLKGPQVLTFGNSATVGAMNMTTRKPGRDFEADGSIGYEFYNHEFQVQGGVTIPMADWASLRLAGLYQDLSKGRLYNPIKDQSEPRTRNVAVRPSLLLSPVPGLEILLKAEVDRLRDYGNAVVPVAQPLAAGRAPYPVVGDKDRRYVTYDVAPYFTDEFSFMNANLYQIDVNYDLLGGKLTSTSAWRTSRSDVQFGTDGVNHAQTYLNALWQHYQQFSQELRFSGTYGRLDVTAGGYYQRDTLGIELLQEFTLGGFGLTGAAATPIGRVATYDQNNRVYSGFVDLSYRLTDRLSLSGGVRYVDIRKIAGQAMFGTGIIAAVDFDTSRADLVAGRNPALDPIFAAVFRSTQHDFPYGTLRLSEDHWQPQAIIQYEIAPRNKAYLKFVRGAKSGGFDYAYAGGTASAAMFRPEFASMFEAGIKGLILDNKLEYSVAAFRTTFTALQQSVFQNLAFVVSNVGKARSQGIELDLTAHPAAGLEIGFSGSYLDAKFVDFPGAACSSAQNAGLQSGCVGGAQDLSGTPTQYASKWTGSLRVDYSRPIGSGAYQVAGGASIFARSRYNAGAYNDPRMEQGGFAQIDAHLDFAPSDDRWRISLFGRNLGDKRTLEYAVTPPAQPSAVVGTYSRGRQIGLKLSFSTR
ncbi:MULTISPECIES: TonB-dependent receptor [Sphingobium]|uniref:TonB-dependent receptor n=1 Tax=Sphingobium TaxID=165695 RepID=UPI00159C51CC|nr:TonB-dependent receptor [Sphingobium sp. 15-1]